MVQLGEMVILIKLSWCYQYNNIIVFITKFAIVIGFPHTLSVTQSARDHVGVQLQVSDLNFFKSDTCNWIPR